MWYVLDMRVWPFLADTLVTQLMGPDLTYSLLQPLYEKYSKMRNLSTVFCFLLNRVHFQQDRALSSMSLSQSRAELCEIMAIKLLKDWTENTMELAVVMTTSWGIFTGAGPDVLAKTDEGEFDVNERVGNAIELAIIGQAKRFIKSASAQKVIGEFLRPFRQFRRWVLKATASEDLIWSGKIVYQAESEHSFLSDVRLLCPSSNGQLFRPFADLQANPDTCI